MLCCYFFKPSITISHFHLLILKSFNFVSFKCQYPIINSFLLPGCAMSVRNIFSEPFQKRLEAYNNKLLWADSSESDLIAYLNAYVVTTFFTLIPENSNSVT